jgi:hypothetical protein
MSAERVGARERNAKFLTLISFFCFMVEAEICVNLKISFGEMMMMW